MLGARPPLLKTCSKPCCQNAPIQTSNMECLLPSRKCHYANRTDKARVNWQMGKLTRPTQWLMLKKLRKHPNKHEVTNKQAKNKETFHGIFTTHFFCTRRILPTGPRAKRLFSSSSDRSIVCFSQWRESKSCGMEPADLYSI